MRLVLVEFWDLGCIAAIAAVVVFWVRRAWSFFRRDA